MTKTKLPEVVFGLDVLDTVTKAEEGVWCNILLPNGNKALSPSGTPVRLKMLGSDSRTYKEAMREQTRVAIERAKLARGDNSADNNGEAEGITVMAKAIVGWEGFESPASTKDKIEIIPFNYDNVVAMLTRYPLVKQQVDVFIGNQANFLLESSRG